MRFSLGRWQNELTDNPYVQVHDNGVAIGYIDSHNVFKYLITGQSRSWNYNSELEKFHGKAYKDHMDCLDHLNGEK